MSNYKVPTNIVLEQNLASAVFVEAKQEYTQQIKHLLDNFLFHIAENEFKNAIETSPDADSILETFQANLKNMILWNQNHIEKQYHVFLEQMHCKWFEQLLGATFLSHIRVLISVRTNSPENTFDLEIPRGSYFFHRCLIEMAHVLFPNPYCFEWMLNEEIDSACEIKKIMLDIHLSIDKAIRSLIPFEQIMQTYFPYQSTPEKKVHDKNIEEPQVTISPVEKTEENKPCTSSGVESKETPTPTPSSSAHKNTEGSVAVESKNDVMRRFYATTDNDNDDDNNSGNGNDEEEEPLMFLDQQDDDNDEFES